MNQRFTEVGQQYRRAVRLVGSFSSSPTSAHVCQVRAMGLSAHECKESHLLSAPSVRSTRAWEVPGCSQPSHVRSSLSAKCTGRGRAQRRGLTGSAAGSSAQPVQIIVVIVTKERCWRGTPLHALEVKPEGNLSVLTAFQYLVIAPQFRL